MGSAFEHPPVHPCRVVSFPVQLKPLVHTWRAAILCCRHYGQALKRGKAPRVHFDKQTKKITCTLGPDWAGGQLSLRVFGLTFLLWCLCYVLCIQAGSGVATLGLPDSPGVPKQATAPTLVAPYNDLETVKKVHTALYVYCSCTRGSRPPGNNKE